MKILFTAIILVFASNLFAQKAQAPADTVATDSSKVSMLTIGVGYGNTANYYGQTTAEKLPFGSADISYRSKSGLWAAASAIKLINTGSGISEVDLSLGKDFDITRRLGASISYTRYFFEENSPLLQSINPNAVSSALLYDWKWFNTGLYGDYLFGNKRNDFFLTLSNSKLIDLGSIFSKNDYVTIEPAIQLTAGTLLAYEEQTTEEKSGPGKGNLIRKVFGSSSTKTTYVESTEFNLLTSTFKLPVAYNRANYSVPNNVSGISHKTQSYFTLGFYYLIY